MADERIGNLRQTHPFRLIRRQTDLAKISKKFLASLDSRIATVDANVKLNIQKGDFQVKLIQLTGQHYFKTLRQKLNWGLDIRN